MSTTDDTVNSDLLNTLLNHFALVAHDIGVDQPPSRFQEAERLAHDVALLAAIEMMQCV